MTTLTRAALLEAAAPKYEVVDVEGFGNVGIRSCPQLTASRRYCSYLNLVTGDVDPEMQALGSIHRLIDQVMADETEPMFSDDDIEVLSALDPAKLSPLYEAIDRFDGGDQSDQKKV